MGTAPRLYGAKPSNALCLNHGLLQSHHCMGAIVVVVSSTGTYDAVCIIYCHCGLWRGVLVARSRNLDDDEIMKEPKCATNLLLQIKR